jgi:hypothetical protein
MRTREHVRGLSEVFVGGVVLGRSLGRSLGLIRSGGAVGILTLGG